MYYRSLRSRVLLEYFIFIILFLSLFNLNKNNIISQKKFYGNYNKILLFKSSDILLGGPKHLRKVIGLEVYQVHHHERHFFVHNSLVVKTAHYHPFAPYIVKYGDLFYLYVPNFTTKG